MTYILIKAEYKNKDILFSKIDEFKIKFKLHRLLLSNNSKTYIIFELEDINNEDLIALKLSIPIIECIYNNEINDYVPKSITNPKKPSEIKF